MWIQCSYSLYYLSIVCTRTRLLLNSYFEPSFWFCCQGQLIFFLILILTLPNFNLKCFIELFVYLVYGQIREKSLDLLPLKFDLEIERTLYKLRKENKNPPQI